MLIKLDNFEYGFGWIPGIGDARNLQLGNYLSCLDYFRALFVRSKAWRVGYVLNQRNTNHCVGFATAAFGIAEPVVDKYTDDDGHRIYYAAKVFDGEPKGEDGTSLLSAAKAFRQMGRIKKYAFTRDINAIQTWVSTKGSLVVGTTWTQDMMRPDKRGYVVPSGVPVGGHGYLLYGIDTINKAFLFQNSWGTSWGLGGKFYMKISDFAVLLRGGGDAMTAVELPLRVAA